MMHYQAGVRTVVVGGLPEAGPMQVPAGSRGAEAYSSLAIYEKDVIPWHWRSTH